MIDGISNRPLDFYQKDMIEPKSAKLPKPWDWYWDIFYLLLLQRLWFLIPWMEDDIPFLIPLWGWLLCWVSIGWVGTPQWFLVSGFKQHQMGRSPAIVEMAMSFWCKYIICIYTVYVCTLYIYTYTILYIHASIYIFIIYYHISLP